MKSTFLRKFFAWEATTADYAPILSIVLEIYAIRCINNMTCCVVLENFVIKIIEIFGDTRGHWGTFGDIGGHSGTLQGCTTKIEGV